MRFSADSAASATDASVLAEIDYDDLEFYERLSSGTYGSVYRAKFKRTGQIVAVKRVLVLEKEAHILSLLRHRNIIQFYGAVTKPPNFCIVTEFASNGSLYDYLHDEKNPDLTFDAMVKWAIDIASGVHYLHSQAPVKILHRDLKSNNVVITSENVCKLCDFGTSKSVVHTTHMSLVGTMPWMSPEMIQSQPVSEATDTWSYGVILWELITRQVPFDNLNDYRIAWMVVENGVRLTIPTSCPQSFTSLMRQCWQDDQKTRPDFEQILRFLHFARDNRSISSETKAFFSRRREWIFEIARDTERLRNKERELTDMQTKLRDWELRLHRREQTFEYNRRRELPTHDVNRWTEDDVASWLVKISMNALSYEKITALANVFRTQQINGERLLLLTDTDLVNLGVQSLGCRRQLLTEIMRLSFDNRRLINFPPLSNAPTNASTVAKDEKNASGTTVQMTLLFGIYVRAGPGPQLHKWKLLMDVDDEDDISNIDLISDVRFVLTTPPYVYKVASWPFVMREWAVGLNGVERVQCVVNFADNVRQPRNTSFTFDVDYEKRGILLEKPVRLHLKFASTPSKTSTPMAAVSTSSSATKVMHSSLSSPVLSEAWRGRTFLDAVPLIPAQTPKTKSTLWSEIVAGLMEEPPKAVLQQQPSSSISRNASSPASVSAKRPELRTPPILNSRAVSDDARHYYQGDTPTPRTSPSLTISNEDASDKGDFRDGKPANKERSSSSTPSSSVSSSRSRRIRNRARRYKNAEDHENRPSADEASPVGAESGISSSTSVDDQQHFHTIFEKPNEPRKQNVDATSSVVSVQVHGGNQKWRWKT